MSASQAVNPYVGPRPFTRSEGNRFFGRDREARALISLVVSERLVLFYAQSGAGKTSLLHARLVPGLEARGFAVLPIGRVSGEPADAAAAQNIFIYNLLLSLEEETPSASDAHDLARTSLPAYLTGLPAEDAPVQTPAEPSSEAVKKEFQPLVLVIDQLEELFTTHPEAWQQRALFFKQLAAAMHSDPNLWIVLSLREDYLAALDPYAQLLPNRFRTRYYMERMGYESAVDAVVRPVAEYRPFDPGAAQQLVDNLRLVSAGEGPDGLPRFVTGEYIEPVQLQVVCYQLWEQLKTQPGAQITTADLTRLAREGDLAQFVSRALADFYEQAIGRVLRHPGLRVTERELREWFSHELITASGTRGFVFQGDEKTGSLPNLAVRLLEDQFIIRLETRSGGRWVELVHDRFTGPILQANQAWAAAHSSPISLDSAAWLRSGQDPSLLYEGRQLDTAFAQMENDRGEFGEKERSFLEAAQKRSAQKWALRQARLTTAVIGLVVIFASLATFGLISAIRATKNASLAQAASTESAHALETAQAASVLALVQQSYAESARGDAVRQSTLAAEARARALEESKISRSSQMAALSAYYLDSRLDVARILSVEAYLSFNGWEARKALLQGLQRGANVKITRESGPLSNGHDIWAVAVSPDGSLIAAGDTQGGVSLWEAARGVLAEAQPPQEFLQSQLIYAVAFDPSGRLLAAAGRDGKVSIWNRDKSQVTTIPIAQDWITNLAFQPAGSLLAATRRDGRVSLIDYNQGKLSGDLTAENLGAWGLAWSPDGGKLAVGFSNGSIRIWDIASQLNPLVLKGHDNNIRGLAWSPDGRFLYSGGRDRRLIVWDVAAGQPVRQSQLEETGDILALALSRDGRVLVTGSADQASPITIWDIDTLHPVGVLSGHRNWVMALSFSLDGGRFASGGVDQSLFTWKVEVQQPLSQVVGDTKGLSLSALGFDAPGRWLALTSGTELSVVAEKSGILPMRLPGGDVKLAVVPGARVAAAVGQNDGKILLRDLMSSEPLSPEISPAPGSILALASSMDGKWVAAAYCKEVSPDNDCSRSGIRIIDLATGLPPDGTLSEDFDRPGKVTALAFRQDGKLLASGGPDGAILLHPLAGQDPASFAPLQGLIDPVTSLAFSPDGGMLAAGLASGSIGLWDTNGYRLIGNLSSPERFPISGLGFRPDSSGKTRLFSASTAGYIREWDVDFSSWAARACSLAGRSLAKAEWAQFFPGDLNYQETCR